MTTSDLPSRLAAESEQRERICTVVHHTADEAATLVAREVADLIRANDAAGRKTVLGLATGSTPVRLYRALIRLHREEGLSFRRVVTFNLDEYYGLPREHPESYWRFMHEQLFDHIDVDPAQVHVPDGTVARGAVYGWCRCYEQAIREAGGLDLQILGIGRTGHIGFNEPGSGRDSRTRLVTLDALTRRDAARDFRGEDNVPRHAITMGVGTILAARRIVLLAWGKGKAGVIADAVERPPTDTLPASFLQGHRDVVFHIDAAAASELTRCRHPWLVGPVEWRPALVRRAVSWLSLTLRKPVLKLVEEDYMEHGMADLLTEQGPAYQLNIRVFNEVQHTITGWPGGKPDADDVHRPERATPYPKRVLICSPEPSDDVLGMGGTLRRLVDQGHHVTVAYLTSGNLAVPDEEAQIAAEILCDFHQPVASGPSEQARLVRNQLAAKRPFDADPTETRQVKGLLRRAEARAAMRASGVPLEQVRFLDLDFYERGRYRQFVADVADEAAVAGLLEEVKPHQIFVTGQETDPSGLAAVTFELLRRAWRRSGHGWRGDCRCWIFRGYDHTWSGSEIDMAVPLSPRELDQKVGAICHHKSQRSQSASVSGRGQDAWQDAAAQNRAIARIYDALGLAEYEAIEAFSRGSLE